MISYDEHRENLQRWSDEELSQGLRICVSLLLERSYIMNATMRSGSSQPVLGSDDIIIKKCTFL